MLRRRPAARGSSDAAGAIYGTVVVLGVIATASEVETVSLWAAVELVLVTALVFFVAHVYARVLAKGTDGRLVGLWRSSLVIGRQEWPFVEASVVPTVALVIGATGAVARDTALWAAGVLGIVDLFTFGVLSARQKGVSWWRSGIIGAVSAGLGVAIVTAKLWLTHV